MGFWKSVRVVTASERSHHKHYTAGPVLIKRTVETVIPLFFFYLVLVSICVSVLADANAEDSITPLDIIELLRIFFSNRCSVI